MGKNAQKRRGDTQPQIDHFIMSGDAYVAIRRYLGSRPHDECRELILHLEAMPAITVDDLALREKQGKRLAELEEMAADAAAISTEKDIDELKRMASAGEPMLPDPDSPPGAIVDNLVEADGLQPDDDLSAIPLDPDADVATEVEEEQ